MIIYTASHFYREAEAILRLPCNRKHTSIRSLFITYDTGHVGGTGRQELKTKPPGVLLSENRPIIGVHKNVQILNMSVVFSTFSLRRQLSLHFRNISITMFYISFKGKMIARTILHKVFVSRGWGQRQEERKITLGNMAGPRRLFPRVITVKLLRSPILLTLEQSYTPSALKMHIQKIQKTLHSMSEDSRPLSP